MRICVRCVLPESFPGVSFDEAGVCNVCRKAPALDSLRKRREHIATEFATVVENIRGRHTNSYECLVSLSGGKDSTFVLSLLVQHYGLRVLAVTFDNGFVSETALANMRRVTDTLGVDHIIVKPSFALLKRVVVASMNEGAYPIRALCRASSICTSCMCLVKACIIRLAIEKAIPLIAYGWTPGQIPLSSSLYKSNPAMVQAMMQQSFRILHDMVGDAIRPFFVEPSSYASEAFPFFASPLAFLQYDDTKVLDRIMAMGWERPSDTDPNSTNCLLNVFGTALHKKRFGFHPYAGELAALVREGHLPREEALNRLNAPEPPEALELVRNRLGLGLLPHQDDWASLERGW